ncbi:MAG: serine/threonine-protein phosphatase [Candidatus Eremiobacteraeota bacterium]|nr:serine/threonine-protein phosphatase [Candidatus Eremiobacteraeota bacterium]
MSSTIAALTSAAKADREYDIAAERIQQALLTVKVPAIAGLELGVRAEPARLVGGDYIDIFCRDGCLLFGLGDASGKSLGAAVNALMLRYLLRGLTAALGHGQIEAIVRHTNSVVSEDLHETDYFITLIMGTLDPRSGHLRLVNAGHEPAMVLREGAADVQVMTRHGIVLGVDRQTNFPLEETTLGIGDRAVFYTDGLTEATNTRGELFTAECLRENVVAHRDLSPQALADELFETVKAYSDGQIRDDATVFVVRRTA